MSEDHDLAMELASEADVADFRGNLRAAADMRAEAAKWEERCLGKATGRRTRSIIGVSLAALQLKAGLSKQCEATCRALLAERLTDRARAQLKEMLDEVSRG